MHEPKGLDIMADHPPQRSVDPADVTPRFGSSYPEPFSEAVAGRIKRALGDPLGLTQFGVNLVQLPPGCWSSQRHWHSHEDEFVYVLEGELVLVTERGETILTPGMAAGFPGGAEDGHHLVNRSGREALYLEIGSRMAQDEAFYSDIDMELRHRPDGQGHHFVHRNGEAY